MPSTLMTNPLQAIMRGGPSAAPPPGGLPPSPPGGAPMGGGGMSQMLAQLLGQQQGADPSFMLKQLTTMRQTLGEMIPKAMVSVEGVAADLGGLLSRFDKVIEKLKKASSAVNLARPPMGFAAAQSSDSPTGGGSMGLPPSGGLPDSGP